MILTERALTPETLARWGFDDDPPAIIMKLPLKLKYWKDYRALNGLPWGLHRTQCLPGERRNWLWKYAGIRPADFVICAGTEGERHPLIGPKTVKLRTCAPDVFRLEEFSPDRGIPFSTPTPYLVFLDEATDVPHPDYTALGLQPPDSKTYLKELQVAFYRSEWVMQLPIVIAAHPARPRHLMHVFDRPCYGDHVTALIRGATRVLAHSSTSIGMAVMLNKPIEIVELLCLLGRPEGRLMIAMKKALARGDYATRYLGTPEALAKPRRPAELLKEYLDVS